MGEHAADQPMPEGSTARADRVMEVRNSGASIGFGRSLYEHGDLDKAPYYYELWEEAPADAVNAQGVTWGQATPEQKEAGGFKKDGVTYDSRHFVAKVSLGTSGDKNEFMTAKIEYFQGSWQGSPDGLTPVPPTESGAADKVLFENAYEAEGSFAGIQVAKELLGRDMKADEFRFSIRALTRRLLPSLPKATSPSASPIRRKTPCAKWGRSWRFHSRRPMQVNRTPSWCPKIPWRLMEIRFPAWRMTSQNTW